MVIRVRRRHICSPRAASHHYRYQLSLTLQGVCGNYILSILPSKRGILFINLCLTSAALDIVQVNLTLFSFARALGSGTLLEDADGVEAWDGMLAYQAQASMPSIRCSKSIQSQMKFFFSKSFLIG